MANENLHSAKRVKNDEFYTKLSDIEREMKHYRSHFAGKTVLCNCNDALHVGFATHFSLAFKVYGLKELICTSFNPDGQGMVYRYHGDINGNNVPDMEEWEKTPMHGNGGFNTPEGIALLDEADIVVTNPPFSLFREFITLLMEHDKKFLVIGNMNAITYKEVFPLIKDNKIWLGTQYVKEFVSDSGEIKKFGNILWYTNLDHTKRHEPIDLYKRYNTEEFPRYDNYDAIEVSKVCDIPEDYRGIMGVPITFLDKYCPEQFEIVGWSRHNDLNMDGGYWLGGKADATINGKEVYRRILIKSK